MVVVDCYDNTTIAHALFRQTRGIGDDMNGACLQTFPQTAPVEIDLYFEPEPEIISIASPFVFDFGKDLLPDTAIGKIQEIFPETKKARRLKASGPGCHRFHKNKKLLIKHHQKRSPQHIAPHRSPRPSLPIPLGWP